MKSSLCGQPITLSPSAEERAAKDVTGKSAGYYRRLFTEHSECALNKRQTETSALVQFIRKYKYIK